MEIVLKLFLLSIMSCTHAEPLLGSIYTLKSGIRVTACSVRGARCEGDALTADWVVVRDSCIRAHNIEHIYVQKGNVDCIQERTTPAIGSNKESGVRSVIARFPHPRAPDVDLSLLRIDWPYKDELDNRTLSANTLKMLNKLMEDILYVSTEETDRSNPEYYLQRQSSAIKMFFVTVMLPAASFIIFFLFIVFFTGTTDTSKIPYKTLTNNKKSSNV